MEVQMHLGLGKPAVRRQEFGRFQTVHIDHGEGHLTLFVANARDAEVARRLARELTVAAEALDPISGVDTAVHTYEQAVA